MMSTMTTTSAAVADDGAMTSGGPRGDRPRRRSWTRAQKIEHVHAYRAAREVGNGNGYLREHGIYSSSIAQWSRAVDAGTLTAGGGTSPVGKPSADQAEIARLRRELEVTRNRLATTETALDIMGKAQELLESISKSSPLQSKHDKH